MEEKTKKAPFEKGAGEMRKPATFDCNFSAYNQVNHRPPEGGGMPRRLKAV